MTIGDRPVKSSILYREDGTPLLTRANGQLLTGNTDEAVALGLITGTSGLAFGYASVAAASIVPIRASTYTEAPAASNLELVSSSIQDAAAGTGSRTVRITYYRNDGTGPYVLDVTMNGTTPVSIGDALAQFVEKVETLTVGSNGTNVGTITIRRADDTTIGTVIAGDGRTYWAHHYVAAGRTCFIRRTISGIYSNALLGTLTANFFLRATHPLVSGSFDRQITMAIRGREGDSSTNVNFESGVTVPGFARITFHVRPDAATAGTVHAGFTFSDF